MENNIHAFEYQMSATMAKEIVKTRKGDDKKLKPQEYLVKYVNEHFGLRYPCIKVTTV